VQPIAEAIGRLGRAVVRPCIRILTSPLFGAARSPWGRYKAPAPKNGVAKPGPARGDAPTDNRAHPNVSTETGLASPIPASHDAQAERRNSSGPDFRGDWGVETEAGAYERPLDGLQPRATLDYHENNRPATSIPRRP